MTALIFALAVLAVSLVVSPLFVRQLRADGRRWARWLEDCKLYEAVSGKVLIPGFPGFEIITAPPGVIPEGTVVFLGRDAMKPEPYGMLTEPLFPDPVWTSDGYYGRGFFMYAPMPVITKPDHIVKITGIS